MGWSAEQFPGLGKIDYFFPRGVAMAASARKMGTLDRAFTGM
jgi:hypothetical protein